MIEYRSGRPTENGVYACRLPIMKSGDSVTIFEDRFMTFMNGQWFYPRSDQKYRDDVHHWIGPLQRKPTK